MLFPSLTRRILLPAACLAAVSSPAFAQSIPPATAIPVVLTRTVAAAHANTGDPVAARTLQAILLPGGHVLPSGTTLAGHIVAATPFRFNAAPYAVQSPSTLSIRFDALDEHGASLPVTLSLRAIAGPVASHEAEIPNLLDEIDWSATRHLIGGDTTSPLDKTVLASDGTLVGYNRGDGVYARLLASVSASDPNLTCDATATEQSVALFSPGACGVYGLNSVLLTGNGAANAGTFTLESRQRSVQLDAGTTALLQVVARSLSLR
jgi:hypothetical protein